MVENIKAGDLVEFKTYIEPGPPSDRPEGWFKGQVVSYNNGEIWIHSTDPGFVERMTEWGEAERYSALEIEDMRNTALVYVDPDGSSRGLIRKCA